MAIDTLFLSHHQYNWNDFKNIKKVTFLNNKTMDRAIQAHGLEDYYSSLEDLNLKVGQWHQILDHVNSIILVDLDLDFPNKIHDNDLHLYINFFLTLKTSYFNKTKNFDWIKNLPGRLLQTNATRKDDNQCIWAAGCSITTGVGVDENSRYVNLISKELNKDLLLLAYPGASVIAQADQILRSDINKGDMVIWGITNYSRIDYAEGLDLKTKTVNSMQFNNQIWKYWKFDYFESYTHSYNCIHATQQVINFCQKIGAKLILVNLLDHAWSSLVFGDLMCYIDLTKKLNKLGIPQYLDLGWDNAHPGTKQHLEYATNILNFIKENNYG